MRPERQDIAAPELPPRTRWLGGEPAPMSELTARGPVLVHFFDFAQLNSVRALPYVVEWSRRYGDHGLVTLGVHSPRHPFTAPVDALEPALGRLGIEHPVADDSGYALWHDYGCEGWPSLFLWGQGGALRWFHFGRASTPPPSSRSGRSSKAPAARSSHPSRWPRSAPATTPGRS